MAGRRQGETPRMNGRAADGDKPGELGEGTRSDLSGRAQDVVQARDITGDVHPLLGRAEFKEG
jgi:hypothetical protein